MDAKRPNILIIVTDQQRYDSLGCYGSDFVNTPCIDRLACNGVRFDRAYCANPVCTPSRVSLFTGMNPSGHGAWNIGTISKNEDMFLSSILKKEGYSTSYIGKMHFSAWATAQDKSPEGFYGETNKHIENFKTPYFGFDNVEISMGHTSFGNHGHYKLWMDEKTGGRDFAEFKKTPKSSHKFGAEAIEWDIPLELHNNTWVAERTIASLRKAKKSEKPFFMAVGFQDPHHPHCLPAELAENTDKDRIPEPIFIDNELDDKPPHFNAAYKGLRNYPSKEKFRKENDFPDSFESVTREEAQLARAYYYKMVEFIDSSVSKIVDELTALELLDDTIIVFTSDHGELLGDHGLWRKGPFHYKQLVRIPLTMHWPKGIKKPHVSEKLVSNTDIAPTMLSILGLDVPKKTDGMRINELFQNDEAPKREYAYIEYVDETDGLKLKTVVTDKYKLTYYHGEKYGELYDLEKDPDEIVNLFGRESMKDIKLKLMAIIMDEMEKAEAKLRVERIASS